MISVRIYGEAPYSVAVLHGGPGAPGSLAPVARELSRHCGVLEPLQSAASVAGQIQELRDVLKVHGHLPVTLIGHSWGAWLGFIFAARHPEMVRRLVLVGSGPFEESYARGIMETRLGRLSEPERKEAREIANALNDGADGRAAFFARFGGLMSKADAYDPLPDDGERRRDVVDALEFQPDVYESVWKEADALRRSGDLLKLGPNIRCPVLAIHGDYDPHPAEGVEKPLKNVLQDFRFVRLENCGHEPWCERAAKERFFEILMEELRN